MTRSLRFLILLSALATGTACDGKSGSGKSGNTKGDAGSDDAGSIKGGSDDAGSTQGDGGKTTSAAAAEACKVVVKDADCDKTQRPFVFVHGTYGSGDNIANVAMLFGSNGYCQDRFVAIEYNSLNFLTGGTTTPEGDGSLDALIDKVRKDTGFDQVDLAGHSQGTGHCDNYMKDPAHAAKVAHYINFSGGGTVPNDVHSLSLSSENDLMGVPHHAPNAEKMVTFTDEDHFGVAASKNAFVAVWKYLHDDKDPEYTEIQCGEDPITLEGISESFADNTVIAGNKIEVRELDLQGDPRAVAKPSMVITPGDDGHIAPIKLKRLVQYDFRAIDADGKTIGHLFYSPFKRSNRLARFLSPSHNAIVAGNSTDKAVKGDGFSALVTRNLAGAFRRDLGDSLKINGEEVLTDANAGKTQIVVGLFISDQNMNGMTDLGGVSPSTFLMLTDVFMDASKPAWLGIEWTPAGGTTTKMTIPNWPSSTEGLLSLSFQ
jgi:pimeloyl-ACP methyl ester carboxylesterase